MTKTAEEDSPSAPEPALAESEVFTHEFSPFVVVSQVETILGARSSPAPSLEESTKSAHISLRSFAPASSEAISKRSALQAPTKDAAVPIEPARSLLDSAAKRSISAMSCVAILWQLWLWPLESLLSKEAALAPRPPCTLNQDLPCSTFTTPGFCCRKLDPG